jgi:small subunit ribosomal protein S4
MARYTGPMTKKSRRLGVDLVGGDQAYERRPYPPGQHGRGRIKESEYLLQLLECRLDNVVYRAGFARTRRHARQLVVHGHFRVNGHKVDIPSYQVSQHDIIDVKEKSLETTPFIVARETHGERIVPAWMQVLPDRMRILIHSVPVRQQIDIPVQEQLIVEYYSKK